MRKFKFKGNRYLDSEISGLVMLVHKGMFSINTKSESTQNTKATGTK